MDSTGPPARELTREEVDQLEGAVVLEFGAVWCNHCQALAPHLARLLHERPAVRHMRVEDGPGRPLGRSFRVKLWPTLVLLRDGQITAQLVRPTPEEAREALDRLAS
ncbi:MAG: thioredoxin family protein [Deltaproteobacteria bacterium]|nr:thioredoxin family protein [Deltaproteobacteria bacterium]